jgi:hypothetical protein
MAVGEFSDDEPLTLVDAAIFPYEDMRNLDRVVERLDDLPDFVVSEQFVLNPGNEFTADLHACKVEGMLEMCFPEVRYRLRSTKSQVPDQLLKDHGLWQTGADVQWEDGRDANDAIIHMLGFVAFDLEHLPTLRKYFR